MLPMYYVKIKLTDHFKVCMNHLHINYMTEHGNWNSPHKNIDLQYGYSIIPLAIVTEAQQLSVHPILHDLNGLCQGLNMPELGSRKSHGCRSCSDIYIHNYKKTLSLQLLYLISKCLVNFSIGDRYNHRKSSLLRR